MQPPRSDATSVAGSRSFRRLRNIDVNFIIDNGKLYLNYNRSVQTMWLKDKAKWITEGDRNWPTLHK